MDTRRVAIVTGAASGLGRTCALVLAADGFSPFLLDIDATGLAETAQLIRDTGAEADIETCNLLEPDDVRRAVDAHARFGTLAALVNVAGIWNGGTVEDITVESWDRMVNIKLRGDFLTIKAAVPWMREAGGGAIVNIGSMSGRTKSVATAPSYVAANAGIIGLTMSTANQHAKDKIRVNCVAPGMIRTPMLDNYSAAELEALAKAIPLGYLSDPVEIANVVSFLVSDKSSYVTGETINANGGMFMV